MTALTTSSPDATTLPQVLRGAIADHDGVAMRVRRDGVVHDTSFRELATRAQEIAGGLIALGVRPGDRVAILGSTRPEWTVADLGALGAGATVVPIYHTNSPEECAYVLSHSGSRVLICEDGEQLRKIESLRSQLSDLEHVFTMLPVDGASWLGDLQGDPAIVDVDPEDAATIVYTSGTTGKPKGAIRSHRACAALSLVTEAEMAISRQDSALLVMPMCHGNSLFFFGAFAYCGAPITIYSRKSFDPEHLLRTLAAGGASFTSLVPTHYIMMLALPEAVRANHDVSAVRKLLISSAPARRDTKLAIMEHFRNAGLYEGYGSTECGWVTMLQPGDQLSKLGSVGRECIGSHAVRLLDSEGNEAADGQPGELYSCNAYTFDGYWNLPDKTQEAFRGEYCTVGDLARRDDDGFIYLVDRKTNMIISGGENVYSAEVENAISLLPGISEVAVIGVPDERWGERVHAIIVAQPGVRLDEAAIVEHCRARIAAFKTPRSVEFRAEPLPKSGAGKVLKSKLRAPAAEPRSP